MSREQCLPPQGEGVTGRECRREPTPQRLDRERLTEARA
jgi:hypothetical protein